MSILLQNIISDYGGIRRPWIGSTDDPLYMQYKFNTGIDVYGKDVYSYASGVVIAVGKDDKYYAVTVQYDAYSCIRYTHLESVSLSAGDAIQQGFYIGRAHEYLHFEYATKSVSDWPVRIGSETYYKQNPDLMVVG